MFVKRFFSLGYVFYTVYIKIRILKSRNLLFILPKFPAVHNFSSASTEYFLSQVCARDTTLFTTQREKIGKYTAICRTRRPREGVSRYILEAPSDLPACIPPLVRRKVPESPDAEDSCT